MSWLRLLAPLLASQVGLPLQRNGACDFRFRRQDELLRNHPPGGTRSWRAAQSALWSCAAAPEEE